jgi:hypothetical protein
MAVQYNPGIVTDGLVLCLDAANKKSYPGTGTGYRDLSISNNNGTLINSPAFSTSNLGFLQFDGADDYVEVQTRNTNLEFQPTQPFSVFCWMYGIPTTSRAILANMLNSGSYPGWDIWVNGASQIVMHLISSWSANAIKVGVTFTYSNTWQYFGYTYDGSCPTTSLGSTNSLNFYINGVLSTSGKTAVDADGFNTSSETITYNTNQRFRLSSRWASGVASNPAQISLGPVQIYNRVVSSNEVLQNFNALRGRFGI